MLVGIIVVVCSIVGAFGASQLASYVAVGTVATADTAATWAALAPRCVLAIDHSTNSMLMYDMELGAPVKEQPIDGFKTACTVATDRSEIWFMDGSSGTLRKMGLNFQDMSEWGTMPISNDIAYNCHDGSLYSSKVMDGQDSVFRSDPYSQDMQSTRAFVRRIPDVGPAGVRTMLLSKVEEMVFVLDEAGTSIWEYSIADTNGNSIREIPIELEAAGATATGISWFNADPNDLNVLMTTATVAGTTLRRFNLGTKDHEALLETEREIIAQEVLYGLTDCTNLPAIGTPTHTLCDGNIGIIDENLLTWINDGGFTWIGDGGLLPDGEPDIGPIIKWGGDGGLIPDEEPDESTCPCFSELPDNIYCSSYCCGGQLVRSATCEFAVHDDTKTCRATTELGLVIHENLNAEQYTNCAHILADIENVSQCDITESLSLSSGLFSSLSTTFKDIKYVVMGKEGKQLQIVYVLFLFMLCTTIIVLMYYVQKKYCCKKMNGLMNEGYGPVNCGHSTVTTEA